MVTHDSRNNEHCAVEKKKAYTISKLLGNSLKITFYHCFCCKHFLHGNVRRQRLLFTRVYISLKSSPEVKGEKTKLFYISTDNVSAV